MNDREYSKKTWIITAVMAIDIGILAVSIKKIIEKTKQENQSKD